MYCKNCGNQTSEDSLFCAKCGTKVEVLKHTEPLGGNTISASNTDDNNAMLRILIGGNSDYYMRQFAKIESGLKSFNWCALLLGPILTLYRKQFSYFAKLFLPALIMPFILPLINTILYQFARPVSSFGYITAINVITYMYLLVALIIGGTSFNKSYRKNLLGTIDKNCLSFVDSNGLANNTAVKKSQPSPTVAIVVPLVYAILMLVVTAIAPSTQQLSQAPFIILSDGTVIFLEEYETGEMLPNAEREKRIAKIDPSLLHTQTKPSSSTDALEYIAVTAKDLSSAYADNRIAANQSYKDKLLEVSGVIYDFGFDDSVDVLYLVLKTDKNNDLLCIFSKDDSDVLASLKKDALVTIRGKCEGKDFMNDIIAVDKIYMNECTVVSTDTGTKTGMSNIIGDSGNDLDNGSNSDNNLASSAKDNGFTVESLLLANFAQIRNWMPGVFEGDVTYEEYSVIGDEGLGTIDLWIFVDGIPVITAKTYDVDEDNSEKYIDWIDIHNSQLGLPLDDIFNSDATLSDVEELALTANLNLDIYKLDDDFKTYAKISYGINQYAILFAYANPDSFATEVSLVNGRF